MEHISVLIRGRCICERYQAIYGLYGSTRAHPSEEFPVRHRRRRHPRGVTHGGGGGTNSQRRARAAAGTYNAVCVPRSSACSESNVSPGGCPVAHRSTASPSSASAAVPACRCRTVTARARAGRDRSTWVALEAAAAVDVVRGWLHKRARGARACRYIDALWRLLWPLTTYGLLCCEPVRDGGGE